MGSVQVHESVQSGLVEHWSADIGEGSVVQVAVGFESGQVDDEISDSGSASGGAGGFGAQVEDSEWDVPNCEIGIFWNCDNKSIFGIHFLFFVWNGLVFAFLTFLS